MEGARESESPSASMDPTGVAPVEPPVKRLVAFAHYDRDNAIDDYVVNYLRGLRQVADEIVFVSDCDLPDPELAKLEGLAVCAHAASHGEYDFGSWKRAVAYCGERLRSFDELLLVNDSCYGPVFPLEHVFSAMASRDLGFWGITQHEIKREGFRRHLQSYFIVLRKPVFMDDTFTAFLNSVCRQESKDDVVRHYELGLTRVLEEAGFLWDSWVEFRPGGDPTRASDFMDRCLFRAACPLMKVSLLRDNPSRAPHLHLWKLLVRDKSMLEAVRSHIRRMTGHDDPPSWHYVLRPFRYEPLGRYGPIVYARNKALWLWRLGLRLFGFTFFYIPILLPRFVRTFLERRAVLSLKSAMRERDAKAAGPEGSRARRAARAGTR